MNAYILTLTGRADRVKSATTLRDGLTKCGFDAEVFPAVDKGRGNWTQHVRRFSRARGLTSGQICCSEGHMRLYQKVLEEGRPGLICEDDAILRYGPALEDFVANHLPERFHWVQLFHGTWNRPPWHAIESTDHWHRVDWGHWGRVAYILSPEGAADLLPRNDPIEWVGDVFFKYVFGDGNTDRRAYVSRQRFFTWDLHTVSRIGPRGKEAARLGQ